ncbi:MAG: elongation factor G [Bacteroidetes bacterium]|nr:elongation factor G [Bacteroidota bacterium]
MKVYQTKDIRNVALVGGAKSGKTTLAESMLFEAGLINRRGSVDDKNTVSDYRDIELERQNSVFSTVMYAEYQGKKINIIDCPGFDDFFGEVVAALAVCDTAMMLMNAQNGVEVGTEVTWRYAARNNVPIVFLMNHLEHENSNFEETVRQLRHSFTNSITPVQYPVNQGLGFNAVIDLLKMKMLKFSEGTGKYEVFDIPASEQAKAEEMHGQLIESAAESDETLMEVFFEHGTLTEEELQKGLKLGIIRRSFFPVFCIGSKHNFGVSRMMEFITTSLPDPSEMPHHQTTTGRDLKYSQTDPTTAFVFKTSIEPHLGQISFLKLYSGEITEAMDMVNGNTGSKERLTQLFAVAGKNREKVEKILPGDIGAAIKLKDTYTNQTLNSPKNGDDQMAKMVYPDPKYRVAVKAKNSADDEKIGGILYELHSVDPTLIVEYSKELKQLILQGQGELHLNIAKWQIEKVNKIDVDFLAPKIPYRETITKSAKATYRHKKQSGGAGQFGEVHMLIHPYIEGTPFQNEFPVRGTQEELLPWGGKLVFNSCIVGGVIDARFMPAILKGIMEKIEEGPLTGSYARDIVVNVYDGKMHPVDSNEISFKLAGRNAFREAFKNAGPKILEPIYDVEVFLPEEKMGDVMTDLQGRRAIIMGMESEGTFQKIRAKVPLAEMSRYSTALSSITSGRATYTMKFGEYTQVPPDVQTQLLKAYEEQEKDEE